MLAITGGRIATLSRLGRTVSPMVVAALVLSILALVVACASAWFTRRQAAAVEAQAHQSSTPDIDITLKPLADHAGDLVLTHVKGPDLDRVALEIIRPPMGSPSLFI